MTDETEQPSPENDAVRRLLAEARHDEPMPADVAARMDRVLADLDAPASAVQPASEAATVESPTAGGIVTRLPVQRRRRAAGLLAAAAAIVVGGVVLAQNLPGPGTGSETASGSAASEGDQLAAGGAAQNGKAPSHAPTAGDSTSDAGPGSVKAVVRDGRVVVRRQSFSADALAGRALLGGQDTRRIVQPAASCVVPAGDERVLAALYDLAPAALVYHLPDGSTQVVDLVLCGSSRPIRSVTLPAP